jgi:F-type H+-transporting ATPase subunit epsilon
MVSSIFHIDIVTPAGIAYSGEAVSLVVPSQLGYLGVLANHAPLVARLDKGRIIIRDNANRTKIFKSENQGFIEVLKNNVTLTLDSAALS